MPKVYIHPGHGGNDPGAIGNGMRESDINLEVALRLEVILTEIGIETRLSRRTDVQINNQRIVIDANSWGAECYIDIHCNAFHLDTANGYETFSPAQHTAFRDAMHHAFLDAITIRDRGAKVDSQLLPGARERLRGVNCPSCLPELAFITANPQHFPDVNILRNQRQDMAQALANGIFDYFGVDDMTQTRFNEMMAEYLRQQGQLAPDQTLGTAARADFERAVINRITDGTRPRQPITREQAAIMVQRGVDLARLQ